MHDTVVLRIHPRPFVSPCNKLFSQYVVLRARIVSYLDLT